MLYAAFISYSHQADGKLAAALQRGLYNFAKPWYRRRAIRLFRDISSLSANPGLWASIEQALRESEFFLLLASHAAATSPWVQREVEWWIKNRSIDKLLIVLTDGPLIWQSGVGRYDADASPLPPSLINAFSDEPLYVDLCWARTASILSLRKPEFRSAVLDLSASLRGKAKDDLDGEDLRQHRRTMRITSAAALTLLLLTIASVVATILAVRSRDQARSQAVAAMAQFEFTRDPELGVRLAAEAFQIAPTAQAEDVLRSSLLHAPFRLAAVLNGYNYLGGRGMAFSPDGHWLLTNGAGYDSNVASVWNTRDWAKAAELRPGAYLVFGIAVSPDSQLAAIGSDKRIDVFQLQTGKLVASHTGGRSPVFSPDSRRIVSIDNARAMVWDPSNGRTLFTLAGNSGKVWDARFSSDGKLILTASEDKTARLWDSATGQSLSLLAGHTGGVYSAALNSDNRLAVTASMDETARIWEVGSQRLLVELRGHSAQVLDARFSPDDRTVLTSGDDSTTRLWDAKTGRELAQLHGSGRSDATFSPDGAFVATASNDGVHLWSTQTGKPLYHLQGHRGPVYQVAFSPDGRLLAAGGSDKTVRVWQLGTNWEPPVLSGHTSAIVDMTVSPDNKALATAGDDGLVALWDIASGNFAAIQHGDRTSSVAFSPQGDRLLTTDAGGATVWYVSTRKVITQLASQNVRTAQFSPDGSKIVTANQDLSATIWNAADGTPLHVLHGGAVLLDEAGFSPDGHLVMATDVNGMIRLWNADTAALVSSFAAGSESLHASFSSNGKELLTSDRSGTQVWNPLAAKPRLRLSAKGMLSLFSLDSRLIVIGDYDKEHAELYNAQTGRRTAVWNYSSLAQSYTYLPFQSKQIAISPTGRFVVTARHDGGATVWSAETGIKVADLTGHTAAATAVIPSSDERWIAVASQDGAVRFYPWEMFAPIEQVLTAARHASRELDQFERLRYLGN